MTDDHRNAPRTSRDDVAPPLQKGSPRATAQPSRKRSGVAAGRIAAAGIGIAAMVGLVANMEVANSKTAAQAKPAGDTGPAAALGALRWEKSAFLGPATQPGRIADAGKVRPIVLTPHTVVKTVGGGSSGGSSGGYSGGYASSSYSAPAAAPVATTSGSGH
jgi:hypothetical protein